MADPRTIARRYARALLDVAREQATIDDVEEELYALAELWQASPDLRIVIAHPSVPRPRKRAAVASALEGKVSDLTIRFVELLIEKRRFELIREIAEEYDELSDEAQGYIKAHVTSFAPLVEAQRTKLLAKLRAFTARENVVLDEAVDPGILGGILVRLGDQVLDGSILGKLRKLHERLLLREDERAQQAAAMAAEALGG